MKKNPLLIGIGLLAALTAIVFVFFQMTGIDPYTGLVQNQVLLWISLSLFLSCIIISIIPGFLFFDTFFLPKKKNNDSESTKEMHCLISALFRESTAIFYIVLIGILLVVLILSIYAVFHAPAFASILFVLFALAAVWGLVRIAWSTISITQKSSDAIVFLLPVLFLAYFCIFEYRSIALAPQTMVYYPEILATVFSLLASIHFVGHCFGRTPTGSCFFFALNGTIFSASVYTSLLIEYCKTLFSQSTASTDSFFMEGARIMVFAALAIWNCIYTIALYKNRTNAK